MSTETEDEEGNPDPILLVHRCGYSAAYGYSMSDLPSMTFL